MCSTAARERESEREKGREEKGRHDKKNDKERKGRKRMKDWMMEIEKNGPFWELERVENSKEIRIFE